ncbi:MAG: YhcH/YjgK/YiaL family protein [Clostridia bacterium]|nr:YhcH/YjgK/YiaL family protein [Clostridia bacterium]
MIFGNIHTYKDCGITALSPYLELLRSLPTDIPDGRTHLDNGVYYTVYTVNLKDPKTANFESHKNYIDLQYILEGTEQMEISPLTELHEVVPYSAEKDCMFWSGEGVMLTFRPGDFAVYAPMDGHKPGLGTGISRKVVIKIPVTQE